MYEIKNVIALKTRSWNKFKENSFDIYRPPACGEEPPRLCFPSRMLPVVSYQLCIVLVQLKIQNI